MKYLGHVISSKGVEADPSKIQAILEWPKPNTVKELRGFIGLTGYYRKFVPGFGKICQPLYNMTKKEGFVWTTEAENAFQKLKNTMISSQVLALPNFALPFKLECDAYDNGIGAVLQQHGRPIAFTSRAIGPKNQSLSTCERELIAIVHAVKKRQSYLQGRHFIIKTDHYSLKYFLDQRANTTFQQKWVSKLTRFDYEIHFKERAENVVADALFRRQDTDHVAQCSNMTNGSSMSCQAISYLYFVWLDE